MAKDQFQRFLTQDNEFGLVVEKLTNTTGSLVNPYEWEDVDAGKELTASNRVVKPKFLGKEAFGDYTHMVKDLRLPSAENRRWYGPAMGDVMGGEPNDDQPVYGTYYTQVTVTYEADRGLGQGDALGGLARSRTTHVFFVADSEPLEPGDSSTEGLIDEETLVGKFIADLEAVAGIGTAPIVPVATSKVGE